MMAHILLEYSSDGPPPSTVDRRMRDLGLTRDGAFFILQAEDRDDMRTRIDELHTALRGSGVRYTITAGRPGWPAEEITETVLEPGPQDTGIAEDELLEERTERVSGLLRSGGRSFDELLGALDMDEATLEGVLEEMVQQGLITAHRGEDRISYRLAGPMLRSMAR